MGLGPHLMAMPGDVPHWKDEVWQAGQPRLFHDALHARPHVLHDLAILEHPRDVTRRARLGEAGRLERVDDVLMPQHALWVGDGGNRRVAAWAEE